MFSYKDYATHGNIGTPKRLERGEGMLGMRGSKPQTIGNLGER
jgi:hypothetical protein